MIINSSPTPDQSISTQLTAFFQAALSEAGGFRILTRDLGISPPNHLTSLAISGFFTDPKEHSCEQTTSLEESTRLINELKEADIIIIGAAMHNHTVTSGLKAYIDQVTRPGFTFKYDDDGPHGLLLDKKIFVIISAGGDYSSKESKLSELVTPVIKEALEFIGLSDIGFIPVYGTYATPGALAKKLASAESQIKEAVQSLR